MVCCRAYVGCFCSTDGWVSYFYRLNVRSDLRMLTLSVNRFKSAYCTVLEMEPLTELFGDMDVIDATLPGMADKIIASQATA